MDAKYYQSSNINVYPSSNSTDAGKLTLEENLTETVTKLTKRNYCYSNNDFKLTLNNNKVEVSPGNVNIQGYSIHVSNESMSLDVPDSTITVGKVYVCLKLAYDSSNHILGDVGVEGGVKYFNGVYLLWMNESSFTDDTLVLGSADWDGTTISNVEENEDKSMIFDATKIFVYPGVSLIEYIDMIPRKYVHRDGDKAIEIDSTGQDIYNGTGGDIYGTLLFKTSREDLGEHDYGIKIGVPSKQTSQLEIKPFNEYASEFKALIGSESTRSYIRLGLSEIAYVNAASTLSIEGSKVSIGQETQVNDKFHVRTSQNRYDFLENEFSSASSFGRILQGHFLDEVNGNYSYIKYNNLDDSKNLSMRYYTDTGVLRFTGLSSSIDFDVNTSFSDLIIKDSYAIRFQPNDAYIKGTDFKFVKGNKSLIYNESMTLSSDLSASIKSLDSVNNSYSELFNSGLITLQSRNAESAASGIKFQGNGSATSVLLSNQYNTNILKLTGNFVVDGNVSTINGGKVFNACYNDGVEFFEKQYYKEVIESGDIVCVDENGLCKKVNSDVDRERVIGVCSSETTYGFALGGVGLRDNEKIPVGLFGRLYVKTDSNQIKAGDTLIVGINGLACKINNWEKESKYIIGMAMTSPKNGMVYMKIK